MKLLAFNKPYGVVCQFRAHGEDLTLADFITLPNIYPAGRLDKDSEGLLLLTDSGPLQHLITEPEKKMPKSYWVQVEGVPTGEALAMLRDGVALTDGRTRPAIVQQIETPPIWEREPPIRIRQHIPTTWLLITITEGRNRQVRRMTATVGFPTLRLVRAQIGPWALDDLPPGQWRELAVPDALTRRITRATVAKSHPDSFNRHRPNGKK
jgi:23S rRNA pseudouridine2457 synthase